MRAFEIKRVRPNLYSAPCTVGHRYRGIDILGFQYLGHTFNYFNAACEHNFTHKIKFVYLIFAALSSNTLILNSDDHLYTEILRIRKDIERGIKMGWLCPLN